MKWVQRKNKQVTKIQDTKQEEGKKGQKKKRWRVVNKKTKIKLD